MTALTLDAPVLHECDSDCLVINGLHHDFSPIYTHAENCQTCVREREEDETAYWVFYAPIQAREVFGEDGVAFYVNRYKGILASRITWQRAQTEAAVRLFGVGYDDLPFE